jgi:hypothetical protein
MRNHWSWRISRPFQSHQLEEDIPSGCLYVYRVSLGLLYRAESGKGMKLWEGDMNGFEGGCCCRGGVAFEAGECGME